MSKGTPLLRPFSGPRRPALLTTWQPRTAALNLWPLNGSMLPSNLGEAAAAQHTFACHAIQAEFDALLPRSGLWLTRGSKPCGALPRSNARSSTRAGQISIFAAIYVYQYTYIYTYIKSISSVYLQYMQYISVYGGSGLAKKVLLTLTSFILTSIGCAILLS
jgi:hypothetical protein